METHHVASCGKWNEPREPAKLLVEGRTKVGAMRGVQGTVAKAVIRALEGNDAGLARGEQGSLECGFDGLKTGVAKNDFAGGRGAEVGG